MNRLACPVETASDLAFDAVVILHCTQRARRNGNKVPRRFRVGKLENPQLDCLSRYRSLADPVFANCCNVHRNPSPWL